MSPDLRVVKAHALSAKGIAVSRVRRFGFFVREQNGTLAKREERWRQFFCSNSNAMSMIAQCSFIQFRELPDTTLDACTNGDGPKNTVLTELEFAMAAFFKKTRDIFRGDAGKEEEIVEVALPGQQSLPFRQASVLNKLAGREGAQCYHGHPGIRGKGSQSISGSGQNFGQGDTSEAAQAQSGYLLRRRCSQYGAEVEIVFREIDSTTVFGDKGMGVTEVAARFIKVKTRTGGEPDGRNALMIEGSGKLIEARDTLAAGGNESINGDEEDAGCLAQAVLRNNQGILSDSRVSSGQQEKEKGGQIALPASCTQDTTPG